MYSLIHIINFSLLCTLRMNSRMALFHSVSCYLDFALVLFATPESQLSVGVDADAREWAMQG